MVGLSTAGVIVGGRNAAHRETFLGLEIIVATPKVNGRANSSANVFLPKRGFLHELQPRVREQVSQSFPFAGPFRNRKSQNSAPSMIVCVRVKEIDGLNPSASAKSR